MKSVASRITASQDITPPLMTTRAVVTASLAVGLLFAMAPTTQAREFSFALNGVFNGNSGTTDSISGTSFAANTPFTMSALFDSSSPNLLPAAPMFSGFVAYAPQSVTLVVGGLAYDVAIYTPSETDGVSVAIFDSTSHFGPPGHYAAGFIQNPVADGAGIVGDWLTATPPFTVSSLTDTKFSASDFFGVGFGSGVCTAGAGPTCTAHAITPIPLMLGGVSYALTLGDYDLEASSHTFGTPTNFPFSAALVPEPASIALLGAGLAGLGWARRRKS